MSAPQAIPEGFNTITPTLVLNDAAQAIELYKKAFGAQEMYKMMCEGGEKVMHACLKIGSSNIFISDANPSMGCAATQSNFYLYMEDVDAAFGKAKQAGLTESMPVQDMFWGDRVGNVKDRFGNSWTLAKHIRDVSPEEMEAGRKEFTAAMAKSKAA